jgi:hypothetical protein
MKYCYRGVRHEYLSNNSFAESCEITGQAIFQLKYRGSIYWVCRYRTADGLTFEERLTPADASLSELSFKLAKL